MKFENYKNKTMRPYIIYADSECTNVKSTDKNKVSTRMVNSVRAYLVCEHDETQNKEFVWYGENCIINMIFDLSKIAEECIEHMRKKQEMKITEAEEKHFKECKKCHICNRDFCEKDVKVRDHDHLTGKYRGAAHKKM